MDEQPDVARCVCDEPGKFCRYHGIQPKPGSDAHFQKTVLTLAAKLRDLTQELALHQMEENDCAGAWQEAIDEKHRVEAEIKKARRDLMDAMGAPEGVENAVQSPPPTSARPLVRYSGSTP